MSTLPLFDEEPDIPDVQYDDRNVSVDWNTFELLDEPPPDWDFPTEFWNEPTIDTHTALEATLAKYDREIDHADANENTLERTAQLDRLLEDRGAFEAELA